MLKAEEIGIMSSRFECLAAATLLFLLPGIVQAAEWTEVLVTTGDTHAVEMADGRQVMTYVATGAIALIAGNRKVPGDSYECAGMIDSGSDGMDLTLSCATTDPSGDMVYSEVTRGKDSDMPLGQGVYSYTGGTGAWSGFTADCTYAVHPMPGGQGVEFGQCTGDSLPPPLAD